MNPNYFVETTLLVEALLKTRKRREAARSQIRTRASSMSMFAIKEFKIGALQYWIWLHNKLRGTQSYQLTLDAMNRNLSQRYRVGGSLEALQAAAELVMPSAYRTVRTKRELDRVQADMHSLALRRLIIKGWKERRSIVDEVVDNHECFSETAPFFNERTGMLDNPSKHCEAGEECGFADGYKKSPTRLDVLIEAIRGDGRPEDNNRRAALRLLRNNPKRPFRDKDCRGLGDAHFALTCPSGSCILTSNARDHVKLAGALGISVEKFEIPNPNRLL